MNSRSIGRPSDDCVSVFASEVLSYVIGCGSLMRMRDPWPIIVLKLWIKKIKTDDGSDEMNHSLLVGRADFVPV
jgi:hypothetical protein